MAAAIEAARAGLTPTLIDEAPRLGGQVYRHLPEPFHVEDSRRLGNDFARGERLRAEFAAVADRVEVLPNTTVLAVWPNREVLWAGDERSGVLRAERLIIAGGAYDRPMPFPGWTLPGVMTAGGVQTLLKTMRIRPGRRVLIAGTGLLILSVAHRLHESGAEVACILDAGDPPWAGGAFPAGWRECEPIKDARHHFERLREANIPFLSNHTVFEAHGPGEVQAASFGAVDSATWRPLKSFPQTIEVDLVVVGFGFVPNTELTELAGCRQEYLPDLGGWVPRRDPLMQSSVSGVFAVGDGAAIGGVHVAMEEGRVAGITAAEQAGVITSKDAADRRKDLLERLQSLAGVRAWLSEISRMRPGLLDLAAPETLACRCEEVSFAEVRAAMEQGAKDLQAVKLLTRLGMGPCQGRNCAPHTGMLLCRATGETPVKVGRINPRPPVKPVTLGALAEMEGVSRTAVADPLDAVGGGAS
jgi:NADPH-dependent 2,4-dienoyl-CoA reductase/sulfur reductase-like enzyme